MLLRLAVVGALVALLGACTNGEQPAQSSSKPSSSKPSPSPSNPSPSPSSSLTDYQARRQEWPVYRAKSKPAEIGVAYRFRLSTHCGVDHFVDFDGSFWRAVHEAAAIDRGDYRKLDPLTERGTMTLLAPDRSRYASNNGPVIDFVRIGSRKRVSPCF